MSTYRAPLRDMRFVLRDLADFETVAKLPGYEDAADVLDPILDEASSFASGVLDPLNRVADVEGCTFKDGAVTTPTGFKDAYKSFAQAGWIGLPVPAEFGGQGLPQVLLGPTLEMWNGANIGFANGPLLNQGAIEAIELCGSDAQKQTYIPKLVSGEWSGTMCLTEPQAGSDLAAVRTSAVPTGDGRYTIAGQKIYITFGEHDLTENIIHLVLARLPDAPEGTKGISMFIVPKVLVNADGSLGERNDIHCAGIEHKLGINGNPTCTMNLGEHGGAIGELVGEANRGLEYMFIMMNAARYSVGVQGLAVADRAYQSALQYAKERIQFRDAAARDPKAIAIIGHPDVRRMLMDCKAKIEAMRALAYVTGAALDIAHKSQDEAQTKEAKGFVEFMIPIVKGWCTETAVEVCSTALQVFGGMGYVEETGIAQQYRDVRITTIYEGTTGIQALDLVGRKLLRDMGATATKMIKRMTADAKGLDTSNADLAVIAKHLGEGVQALTTVSQWLGMNAMGDLRKAFACSVPYLNLWGTVAGGWQMARAAKIAAERIAAGDADAEFYRAKLATARFYATHVLTKASALAAQITEGSGDVMTLTESQFELDRSGGALAMA